MRQRVAGWGGGIRNAAVPRPQRSTGHTGWDGLGDGGAHAIVPMLARKQQPSKRRYDPWGHWGSYYGPMIANPF
jgi:hypothetical protein